MLIDQQEYKDKLLRAIADYHKSRKKGGRPDKAAQTPSKPFKAKYRKSVQAGPVHTGWLW